MRSRILLVLTAGLITVGCSGDPAPEAADTTQLPTSAPGAESAADGRMTVSYEAAETPEAINGRALMQDNRLLEDLAADINESLKLPHDISLRGAQCDQPNAFWDASANSITLCYEDADWAQQIFTEAGDPDPIASAINSQYATFYHEVGHMAVTIYDLPVTGREEDVADQLAAYVLLTPGEDGVTDPASVQAVKDFAWAFGASGAETTELNAEDFADVHSLDETRMYNLECWIYGSNPEANADMISDGQLPEERASGCDAEWAQLEKAWSTLLYPHFK
ncbi:DUF4344 domain-containing metallopeptidase [Mycolicibacterium pulveris]|uniref:DUF4344 domain-containing metallopeptidase n=1 Tax=Mycolicibacterium pulveris TaxID=36813 RepID=UPI003CFB564B